MAKQQIRLFKRSRANRAQFKREQKKIWSIRIKKTSRTSLSKKAQAQLQLLDINFSLMLLLHAK